MEYRFKKINIEIDRISKNGVYTLKQTQDIVISFLKEIEDTGELIRAFNLYKVEKEKIKED